MYKVRSAIKIKPLSIQKRVIKFLNFIFKSHDNHKGRANSNHIHTMIKRLI